MQDLNHQRYDSVKAKPFGGSKQLYKQFIHTQSFCLKAFLPNARTQSSFEKEVLSVLHHAL